MFLGIGQVWGKQFKQRTLGFLKLLLRWKLFCTLDYMTPSSGEISRKKMEEFGCNSSLKVSCLNHALFLIVRKIVKGTKIWLLSRSYQFYAKSLDIHYHSDISLLGF